MRIAWLCVALVACNDRCASKNPEVRIDPVVVTTALPSAAPSASASASAGESAAPTPSDDAGCKTAKQDALERYRKYCEDNAENCKHHGADFLGDGYVEPDLDGDGVREIAWGWGPMPVNDETHLYSGKPGCVLHLATLPGNASIKALATKHEGYADISAEDTSHCEGMCSCTPDVHVFVFKEGEYREDPKRHVKGTAQFCAPPPPP